MGHAIPPGIHKRRELLPHHPGLENAWGHRASLAVDIHEHMPLLAKLAQEPQVKRVTEFGVRTGLGSTVAFLRGQPELLVSWDISAHSIHTALTNLGPCVYPYPMTDARYWAVKMDPVPWPFGKTRWEPRVGSTLEIPVEETDILFIDTLHTYAQLKAELTRHGDAVRRYIVLHDTAEGTFGRKGEDGSTPGLRAAVREFQLARGFHWTAVHDSPDCNGLIVLYRKPYGDAQPPLCFFE